MELDALTSSSTRQWARTTTPKGTGGGKFGGKATGAAATTARPNETQGWWMRPCRFCQPLGLRGQHMDKDCPRKPAEPGSRPAVR
eukprot:1338349-Heterocapsa_arctica.AAC.1